MVRKHGSELVSLLFGLFRTLKVFDLNNKNTQDVLLKFRQIFDPFMQFQGSVNVQLIGSQYFINQNKVVVGMGGYDTLNRFADAMSSVGIGAMIFQEGIADEELCKFGKYFMDFKVSPDMKDRPFDEFSVGVDNLGCPNITLKKIISGDTISSPVEKLSDEVSAYLKTIYVLVKIFESVEKGDRINMKNAKRAIQKMVAVVSEDPDKVVTLLRVADIKNQLAFHSVNVAMYSILIAIKMGLPKQKIAEIGVCGLFHDIGMLKVPLDIRNTPGPLGREQWQHIWNHPVEGAKMLLRTDRMVEVISRAIQVTFQHQMREDDMGYPQTIHKEVLNLYTRIIKVADAFDAMTTDRPHRPMKDEEVAFHEIMDQSDTAYERLLVKVLVNIMGVYPVGTSVKLNTGEIGIVQEQNPDHDYRDKPVVRVYADAYGKSIDKTVNLMEKEFGVFKYWIVPFDQHELDLNVSEFISIM